MSGERLYLGIDVGTTSARAALFDRSGARRGIGTTPFPVWKPAPDFVQQSSAAIWQSVCASTRSAIKEAGAAPDDVVGIGFDATCSLVVMDGHDARNADVRQRAMCSVIVRASRSRGIAAFIPAPSSRPAQ